MVSIHAPARGATEYLIGLAPLVAFQSTPLREGRLMISPTLSATRGFNPRPCARGDRKNVPPPCGETVSIHAPARGATLPLISYCPVCPVSIHAPARGATSFSDRRYYLPGVSIHAPARGATITNGAYRIQSAGFNPRPCARGDDKYMVLTPAIAVSIHAPARGAT